MTALSEYQRLEAPGLWRPDRDTERREVIVSIGTASLAIYDRSETPLTHWSLPAVERRNPGEIPAIYAPGPQSVEDLEIDDDTMIAAIERVEGALGRRHARGWLQRGALGLVTLGILAVTLLWLPGALVRHAAAVAPPSVRAETGDRLLTEITRITGPACRGADGGADAALAAFADRVLGPGAGQIVVLRQPVPGGAAILPGRGAILSGDALAGPDGPAAAAGLLVAAETRAGLTPPMERVLAAAGPLAAARLLTRGHIPQGALAQAAARILTDAPEPLPADTLAVAMARAGIAAGADATPVPLVSAAEWQTLRTLCTAGN